MLSPPSPCVSVLFLACYLAALPLPWLTHDTRQLTVSFWPHLLLCYEPCGVDSRVLWLYTLRLLGNRDRLEEHYIVATGPKASLQVTSIYCHGPSSYLWLDCSASGLLSPGLLVGYYALTLFVQCRTAVNCLLLASSAATL